MIKHAHWITYRGILDTDFLTFALRRAADHPGSNAFEVDAQRLDRAPAYTAAQLEDPDEISGFWICGVTVRYCLTSCRLLFVHLEHERTAPRSFVQIKEALKNGG